MNSLAESIIGKKFSSLSDSEFAAFNLLEPKGYVSLDSDGFVRSGALCESF